MDLLPQEIEVWYILPTLRKELSKRLIEKGYKQKQIAKILGITEAAISQYKSSKRASSFDIKLTKKMDEKTTQLVDKIYSECSPQNYKENIETCIYDRKIYKEIYNLLKLSKEDNMVCDIHKELCDVKKSCTICFD